MAQQDIDPDALKATVKDLDKYLWNIANNVICSICHELFNKPVTTTCGHNFCSNCLKRSLHGSENAKSGCPFCRRPIKSRGANNHLLSRIANVCGKFPAAFEEDVMKLSPALEDFATELVNDSRVSGLSLEKCKVKDSVSVNKHLTKRRKEISQGSKCSGSLISCSMLSDISENSNVKDESMGLKSVSQVPSRTETRVSDSTDIEKTLRQVKKIPSKQKVCDWLQKVELNKNSTELNTGCSYMKGEDSAVRSNTVTSMIRVDYEKSKVNTAVENVTSEISEKNAVDPYEFIASQETGGAKRRKCVPKGRRKTIPVYQTMQTFSKDSIKKHLNVSPNDSKVITAKALENSSPVWSDVNDDNLKRTTKTYSIASNLTKTVIYDDSKVEEDLKILPNHNQKKISQSEESNVSTKPGSGSAKSVIFPRARRKILPLCSDTGTSDSTDSNESNLSKKAKTDDGTIVLDDTSSHGNRQSETASCKDDITNKENSKPTSPKASVVPERCYQSPGWSRVTTLQMDFENAQKKSKYCRKSLNISGGELNMNRNRNKGCQDVVLEIDKDMSLKNDVYIEDLSQTSELVTGFDSQAKTDKEKYFKATVEEMEKELEMDILDNKEARVEELRKSEVNNEEQVNASEEEGKRTECKAMNTVKDPRHLLYKTPNRKTIPFTLLGKIKKRKKPSIVFIKLGQLSPRLKGSTTVMKLVFPKSMTKKVVTRARETQTDAPVNESDSLHSKTRPSREQIVMTDKSAQCIDQKSPKVEVEIQTTQSYFQSSTIAVQTTQKSVKDQAVGSEDDILPLTPQIFEEFNTPHAGKSAEVEKKKEANVNSEVDIDPVIESELNKTWATQAAYKCVQSGKASPERGEKEVRESDDEELIDLDSNGTEVLMGRVMDNIKLDLSRAKAASARTTPPKRGFQLERCEESDSDIFIEQTPPKNTSVNSPAKANGKDGSEARNGQQGSAEESFLILSRCESNVPDYDDVKVCIPEEQCKTKIVFPTKRSFCASARKENNENNQNQLNRDGNDKFRKPIRTEKVTSAPSQLSKKVCIATSGITNRKVIDAFLDKFKVECLKDPKKEMTHLVVGLHKNDDDELVPLCTPKLLYAMSNKKWVVTEAWIENCLKANAIIGEEAYESVDPVGGNGCARARQAKKPLLENWQVFLLGEQNGISTHDFAALIMDCGGEIVRSPSEFSYSQKKIRMILADCPEDDGDPQFEVLMRKYRTLVMSRNVIIVSIQSYSVANFSPFILHSSSVEEFVKWGYPYELVHDADDGSENE